MTGLFDPIIQNLESIITTGGYYTLLVLIILDSIPVIGIIVPGSTVIIVGGFLSSIGVLDLSNVIFVSIAGALLGDILGYFLGKRYGYALLDKIANHVIGTKSYVDKARNAIVKNTAITVFLGRFNPATRSFVPFTIGASGVKFNSFWIYDCLGSIGWAFSFVALGYIFGGSYSFIEEVIGTFSAVGVISIVFILWGYSFINKNFHIWSKYEVFSLIANLVSIYIFFKTLEDTITVPSYLVNLDVWVNSFVYENINNFLIYLAHTLSTIGSPYILGLIIFIMAVFFFIKRNYRQSLLVLVSFGTAIMLSTFIKDLVLRSRPYNALIELNDFSFPSTHATVSALFTVLFIYTISSRIKNLWIRETVVLSVIIYSIGIAFSRVILGVHWLSDVIAGYALGIFASTAIILLIKYSNILKIFITKDK